MAESKHGYGYALQASKSGGFHLRLNDRTVASLVQAEVGWVAKLPIDAGTVMPLPSCSLNIGSLYSLRR